MPPAGFFRLDEQFSIYLEAKAQTSENLLSDIGLIHIDIMGYIADWRDVGATLSTTITEEDFQSLSWCMRAAVRDLEATLFRINTARSTFLELSDTMRDSCRDDDADGGSSNSYMNSADMTHAYLQSNLEDPLYMRMPPELPHQAVDRQTPLAKEKVHLSQQDGNNGDIANDSNGKGDGADHGGISNAMHLPADVALPSHTPSTATPLPSTTQHDSGEDRQFVEEMHLARTIVLTTNLPLELRGHLQGFKLHPPSRSDVTHGDNHKTNLPPLDQDSMHSCRRRLFDETPQLTTPPTSPVGMLASISPPPTPPDTKSNTVLHADEGHTTQRQPTPTEWSTMYTVALALEAAGGALRRHSKTTTPAMTYSAYTIPAFGYPIYPTSCYVVNNVHGTSGSSAVSIPPTAPLPPTSNDLPQMVNTMPQNPFSLTTVQPPSTFSSLTQTVHRSTMPPNPFSQTKDTAGGRTTAGAPTIQPVTRTVAPPSGTKRPCPDCNEWLTSWCENSQYRRPNCGGMICEARCGFQMLCDCGQFDADTMPLPPAPTPLGSTPPANTACVDQSTTHRPSSDTPTVDDLLKELMSALTGQGENAGAVDTTTLPVYAAVPTSHTVGTMDDDFPPTDTTSIKQLSDDDLIDMVERYPASAFAEASLELFLNETRMNNCPTDAWMMECYVTEAMDITTTRDDPPPSPPDPHQDSQPSTPAAPVHLPSPRSSPSMSRVLFGETDDGANTRSPSPVEHEDLRPISPLPALLTTTRSPSPTLYAFEESASALLEYRVHGEVTWNPNDYAACLCHYDAARDPRLPSPTPQCALHTSMHQVEPHLEEGEVQEYPEIGCECSASPIQPSRHGDSSAQLVIEDDIIEDDHRGRFLTTTPQYLGSIAPLYVRGTRHRGLGVFSECDIAPGDILCEMYSPRRVRGLMKMQSIVATMGLPPDGFVQVNQHTYVYDEVLVGGEFQLVKAAIWWHMNHAAPHIANAIMRHRRGKVWFVAGPNGVKAGAECRYTYQGDGHDIREWNAFEVEPEPTRKRTRRSTHLHSITHPTSMMLPSPQLNQTPCDDNADGLDDGMRSQHITHPTDTFHEIDALVLEHLTQPPPPCSPPSSPRHESDTDLCSNHEGVEHSISEEEASLVLLQFACTPPSKINTSTPMAPKARRTAERESCDIEALVIDATTAPHTDEDGPQLPTLAKPKARVATTPIRLSTEDCASRTITAAFVLKRAMSTVDRAYTCMQSEISAFRTIRQLEPVTYTATTHDTSPKHPTRPAYEPLLTPFCVCMAPKTGVKNIPGASSPLQITCPMCNLRYIDLSQPDDRDAACQQGLPCIVGATSPGLPSSMCFIYQGVLYHSRAQNRSSGVLTKSDGKKVCGNCFKCLGAADASRHPCARRARDLQKGNDPGLSPLGASRHPSPPCSPPSSPTEQASERPTACAPSHQQPDILNKLCTGDSGLNLTDKHETHNAADDAHDRRRLAALHLINIHRANVSQQNTAHKLCFHIRRMFELEQSIEVRWRWCCTLDTLQTTSCNKNVGQAKANDNVLRDITNAQHRVFSQVTSIDMERNPCRDATAMPCRGYDRPTSPRTRKWHSPNTGGNVTDPPASVTPDTTLYHAQTDKSEQTVSPVALSTRVQQQHLQQAFEHYLADLRELRALFQRYMLPHTIPMLADNTAVQNHRRTRLSDEPRAQPNTNRPQAPPRVWASKYSNREPHSNQLHARDVHNRTSNDKRDREDKWSLLRSERAATSRSPPCSPPCSPPGSPVKPSVADDDTTAARTRQATTSFQDARHNSYLASQPTEPMPIPTLTRTTPIQGAWHNHEQARGGWTLTLTNSEYDQLRDLRQGWVSQWGSTIQFRGVRVQAHCIDGKAFITNEMQTPNGNDILWVLQHGQDTFTTGTILALGDYTIHHSHPRVCLSTRGSHPASEMTSSSQSYTSALPDPPNTDNECAAIVNSWFMTEVDLSAISHTCEPLSEAQLQCHETLDQDALTVTASQEHDAPRHINEPSSLQLPDRAVARNAHPRRRPRTNTNHEPPAQRCRHDSPTQFPIFHRTRDIEGTIKQVMPASTLRGAEMETNDWWPQILEPLGDFVIYLGSGPSRPGDFASSLWKIAHIYTLDIDIVQGGSHHDLRDLRVTQRLCELATSTKCKGAMVSLECRTWSVARYVQTGDETLPQVLRNLQYPLGIPDEFGSVPQLVSDANTMADHAVRICETIEIFGGHFIIESPPSRAAGSPHAIPGREDHAAFWTHPSVQQLIKRHGNLDVIVDQCVTQQVARKTTQFSCSEGIFLSALRHLAPLRCNHPLMRSRILGRDTNGSFLSRNTQHYSPMLNEALAKTFMEAIQCPSVLGCDLAKQTRLSAQPHNSIYTSYPVHTHDISGGLQDTFYDALLSEGRHAGQNCTWTIIDSGCAIDVEDQTGTPGFVSKEPTGIVLKTGTNEPTKAAFQGTHVQFLVTTDFHVYRDVRHNVVSTEGTKFKRSLMAPRTANQRGLSVLFLANEQPSHAGRIKLDDGKTVQLHDNGKAYYVKRYFSESEARMAAQHAKATHVANTEVDQRNSLTVPVGHRPQPRQTRMALVNTASNSGTTATPGKQNGDDISSAQSNESMAKQYARLWHRRLAHRSPNLLAAIAFTCDGLQDTPLDSSKENIGNLMKGCDICPQARMCHKPHPKHDKEDAPTRLHGVHKFGDLVSTDHAGPLPQSFQHGYKYARVFCDAYTGDVATYCQVRKDAACTLQVTKQYECDMAPCGTIRRYHSDGAKELIGKAMQEHTHERCEPCAITWIVAEHPNLNAMAEGSIWTTFSMVRAMLLESGLPHEHWAAAFTYSGYLLRRLPKRYRRLDNNISTAYEQLYSAKPNIKHVRLFGCVAHGLKQASHLKQQTKLEPRSYQGFFVGFSRYKIGGVLLYVPGEPKYITVYSVRTDETRTFKSPQHPAPSLELPVIDIPPPHADAKSSDDRLKPPPNKRTRIAVGTRVEIFGEKDKWWPATIINRQEENGGYIHQVTYDGYKRKYWHNFDEEEWKLFENSTIDSIRFEDTPTIASQVSNPHKADDDHNRKGAHAAGVHDSHQGVVDDPDVNHTAGVRPQSDSPPMPSNNPDTANMHPQPTQVPTSKDTLDNSCARSNLEDHQRAQPDDFLDEHRTSSSSSESEEDEPVQPNGGSTNPSASAPDATSTGVEAASEPSCVHNDPEKSGVAKPSPAVARNARKQPDPSSHSTEPRRSARFHNMHNVPHPVPTAQNGSNTHQRTLTLRQTPARLASRNTDALTTSVDAGVVLGPEPVWPPNSHTFSGSLNMSDAVMGGIETYFHPEDNPQHVCEEAIADALATRIAVVKMVADEDGVTLQPRRVARNFKEAVTGDDAEEYWNAMRVEFNHHKRAGTGICVIPPKGAYIMGSTWSYDLKLDGTNRIKRYKARFCAQGFSAREGFEYMYKYSSAAGIETFRMFLATAAYQGWMVREADYSTAYLNAPVDTVIYIEQPQGFEERGPNNEKMVWLLKRAIYGLPHSGRLWQEHHTKALLANGFTICKAEETLFKKVDEHGNVMYLLVNVDNLYTTGSCDKMRQREIAALQSVFELNDLGPVEHTLGIRVHQSPQTHTISIDQEQYIKAAVSKFLPDGYPGTHKRTVPCQSTILQMEPLPKDHPDIKTWSKPCLRLGGTLQWIACVSRIDIGYALNMCMRCVKGASEELYSTMLAILIYLDLTATRKITYGRNANQGLVQHLIDHTKDIRFDCFGEEDLITFVDTSGGPHPIQCAIVTLFGGYVCARVSKLESTTLSVCEAEWFGATTGATMLMAAMPILEFLNVHFSKPMLIFCDNKAACMLSNSNHTTKRMRHVAVRLAFLQERVAEGEVQLVHIATSGNLADIGTKPLCARQHHFLCEHLWS